MFGAKPVSGMAGGFTFGERIVISTLSASLSTLFVRAVVVNEASFTMGG